jgi:hypothetical protein
MSPKMIEVSNRMGRGADLGIGACLAATSNPEHTPPHLALQARRLAIRFGFTPERARVVAGLAFEMRGRR